MEEAISRISIETTPDDTQSEWAQDSPPPSIFETKWGDQSVTTTQPPPFIETEPYTANIDPVSYRKRSHFNGRPFASWGSLFPPLYGSKLLPLAPMTEKFWWQVARDQAPTDLNVTGVRDQNMVEQINNFMAPCFSQQQWDMNIMEKISFCRTSTMNPGQCIQIRQDIQEVYPIKFPKSSAMYGSKYFRRRRGLEVPIFDFKNENHKIYASRSSNVGNFK